MHIDHFTIRTRNIEKAREFFKTVFELEDGERPKAISRIPGCWLYSEGRPIVHIIGSHGIGFEHAAEAIDHAALRMTGYHEFRRKLERMAIPYSTMDLAEIEERRLFLRVPGGALLEAVFSEPVPFVNVKENEDEF